MHGELRWSAALLAGASADRRACEVHSSDSQLLKSAEWQWPVQRKVHLRIWSAQGPSQGPGRHAGREGGGLHEHVVARAAAVLTCLLSIECTRVLSILSVRP